MLDTTGLLLYTDICENNAQISDPKSLTKKQVEMILSLLGNGVYPETTTDGERVWVIPHKKKQGGHLTQSFAAKFFISEK